MGTGLGVTHLDLVLYDVVVLVGALLGCAHALDILAEYAGRAVNDGEFGSVDLDKAVVNAGGI